MASLSLCPQSETNVMLNRKVIKLLLKLKSANAHGKSYIKVEPHLVRHLSRNCLLESYCDPIVLPSCKEWIGLSIASLVAGGKKEGPIIALR